MIGVHVTEQNGARSGQNVEKAFTNPMKNLKQTQQQNYRNQKEKNIF